jgi:hypothetical protein
MARERGNERVSPRRILPRFTESVCPVVVFPSLAPNRARSLLMANAPAVEGARTDRRAKPADDVVERSAGFC